MSDVFSKIDISALSIPQLEDLAVRVQDEIQAKRGQARRALLSDMERIAKEAGISLRDLFDEAADDKKPAKARKPVAPKYRNPNDHSQTWSGRGRQPLWLVTLLAEGKVLKDLEIA